LAICQLFACSYLDIKKGLAPIKMQALDLQHRTCPAGH
jgi:hypothetical protein